MIPYEAPDEYADALIHRVLKETRGSCAFSDAGPSRVLARNADWLLFR